MQCDHIFIVTQWHRDSKFATELMCQKCLLVVSDSLLSEVRSRAQATLTEPIVPHETESVQPT